MAAAHAGLATTGHNIANAATPGYSRQAVVQSAAPSQKNGNGYLGGGTVVSDVRRSYNELLTSQVRLAQSSQSASTTYFRGLSTIDNMLGDGSDGLSPAIQDFFKGLQGLSTDPLSAASRQAVLSSGESMSAQFRTFNSQLTDSRENVNSEIVSSVQNINSYAKQIGDLNESISLAISAGQTPNDLLDQRDQAVLELSKEIKVSVVNDGQDGFNVFIGNGQPLVVGAKTYVLTPKNSESEPGRLVVAYRGDTKDFVMPEESVAGGKLGGLFEFRAKTLDLAQNMLGRMAIVFSESMNEQNKLGLDQAGKQGGDIFTVGSPISTPSAKNTSSAIASASIVKASDLTTSNYKMKFDGTNYTVTRMSDGDVTTLSGVPQTIDGVSFGIGSGAPAAGDEFLIQPSAAGAEKFGVKISDVKLIATSAPVVSASPVANVGTGKISDVRVDKTYFGSPLSGPISLTISGSVISGFPDGSTQAYTPGGSVSYGGMSFSIDGSPAVGDVFTIGPATPGARDGRNAVLLGGLQSANIVGGTTTIQGSFGELVSNVGNKARELSVTSGADTKILNEAVKTQQSESGVNLDEEAANLMKYQQAYQAAGKLMQTANTMFDVLLTLG